MIPADWIAFWESKHSIYVSRRHEAAHFRRIAEDIRRHAPSGGAMLDYGCGEALSAAIVAEQVERLILCEPAPQVRSRLAARFAGNGRIAVRAPEEVAAMPPQSLDAIVLHSVAQYLSAAELDALLSLFHRLLKPGGLLVVGDVIPHDVGAVDDAWELMRFGVTAGFGWAAAFGLVRTYFSGYRRLRRSLGLARYNAGEIMAKLDAARFSAERIRPNIGHNAKRMTFLAHAR
jgi:SAM-dependent methyltransferase